MATATQLTKNDRAVLGAILDSEAGLGDSHATIQVTAATESPYDAQTRRDIRQREKHILLPINVESPSKSVIEAAIIAFDKLLQDYPQYASGYNNRAQARRLLYTDFETLAQHLDDFHAILDDLAKAISLASPEKAVEAVSPESARVLSSAHTHRAYLLYKASQMEIPAGRTCAYVPTLAKLDSERLLEIASRDFASGGRYGNTVAKQLAVHTNPYAKLCGNIVKEAMQKELECFARRTDNRINRTFL